jgi:hypothetical protein
MFIEIRNGPWALPRVSEFLNLLYWAGQKKLSGATLVPLDSNLTRKDLVEERDRPGGMPLGRRL